MGRVNNLASTVLLDCGRRARTEDYPLYAIYFSILLWRKILTYIVCATPDAALSVDIDDPSLVAGRSPVEHDFLRWRADDSSYSQSVGTVHTVVGVLLIPWVTILRYFPAARHCFGRPSSAVGKCWP